jgi:Transglycosylase SLT domain
LVTLQQDLCLSLAERAPQNASQKWVKPLHYRSIFLAAPFVAALLAATQSNATKRLSEQSVCDLAAARAAQNSTVPLEILMSISRVETGRNLAGETQPWPWAINQGGQGYWFDDASQAVDFANDLLAEGKESFDVGCFQINQHWHGGNFSAIEDMFDPDTNAAYAAQFLTELLQSEGGWPQAVAAYHSRSPDEAQAYLTKVETALNDLRAAGPTAVPQDDLVAVVETGGPRINRFPLLQSGARGGAGSLVPVTQGGIPLFADTP